MIPFRRVLAVGTGIGAVGLGVLLWFATTRPLVPNGSKLIEPAGGASQEVRDIRVEGGRAFVLGHRIRRTGSTLSELLADGRTVLLADVAQSTRAPLFEPSRVDVLMLVGGTLVYAADDDNAPVSASAGFVTFRIVDGSVRFVPTGGGVEEVAEGRRCVYFEALSTRPGSKDRNISCLDPLSNTLDVLPLVAPGYDAIAMFPLSDGRLRVQFRVNRRLEWFEWDGRAWSRTVGLAPGLSDAAMLGWSGGRTIIEVDGERGELRRVDGDLFVVSRSQSFIVQDGQCNSMNLDTGLSTHDPCLLERFGQKQIVMYSDGAVRLEP